MRNGRRQKLEKWIETTALHEMSPEIHQILVIILSNYGQIFFKGTNYVRITFLLQVASLECKLLNLMLHTPVKAGIHFARIKCSWYR